MQELFSLGELYPSDFLQAGVIPASEKVEMKLIMQDGLVRLEKSAPANQMYGKYWYRSGINKTMNEALKDIVSSIQKVQKINRYDIWLDIACNDGTLLSHVPKECIRVGIDPAEDSFKIEAKSHSEYHIQDFFSADTYKREMGAMKAKVVTSIAMFYDVENPTAFIKDVYEIMDDEGLWVMQLSYSPLMIRQNAFDNICHEHIYYYSLFNLKELIEKQGFTVTDTELNDVNGGSMRVFIRKSKYAAELTNPLKDVSDFRIASLLALETGLQINNPETWKLWFAQVQALKAKTVNFIKWQKSQGKTVWAYGASTKGNTLLQYFGLDNTLITGIAERNKDKWGLRTIGTNIPIYSEGEMRSERPDFLLILPWHFIREFKEREKQYLNTGGKMIVPCPTFQIIEK